MIVMPTARLLLAGLAWAVWGAAAPAQELYSQVIDETLQGGSAVVSADFDLDGRVDLAGAGYYAGSIRWWRNLGHNQWELNEVFQLDGAFSLKAADLDGDGDTDLYGTSIHVTESGEDTVWWFENQLPVGVGGVPSFVPHFLYANPNQDPRSIHAADFDGDGNLDLAVAYVYDSAIHLFLNVDGTGPAGSPQFVHSPGVNGVSFVVGDDFDQDGDVDLIAGTAWDWVGTNNFYWFPNDGTGQFGRRIPIAGGPEYSGSFTAVVADVDGDGDRDLVTSGYGEYGFPILRWVPRENAQGTRFGPARVIDDQFSGTNGDQSLVAYDLDRDGDEDLVGGSSFLDPRLGAWINDGQGRFKAVDIELGFNAHGVTVADIDGDGTPEIAAASWGACCYSGELRLWSWSY